MPMFRKRPVTIEAVHFTNHPTELEGFGDGREPEWYRIGRTMDSDEVGSITYSVDGNGPYLRIQTIDGAMRVSQGYWIIRGVHGELSLCSPDLFAKNYEPAQ